MLFSIGFGSLMFDMQDSRHRILDETIKLTNFTDGFIYTNPANISEIQPILNNLTKDYLDKYELRIFMNMKYDIKGYEYDGLIVGVNTSETSHINALIDKNKQEILDYEYCFEYAFASTHNIKIGENITLKFGSIEKNIEILDIGFNSEFMYFPLIESIAFPSYTPFPILYVSLDYLNNNFIPYNGTFINEILYKLNPDKTQEEFEEKINEDLGLYIQEILSQKENPFINIMIEDEKSDRQFLFIFALIFIIGSLFVLVIVLHRLIEFDLKSISVFQGLGATKKEIILSYLIFNLILFIISLILGGILGIVSGIPFTQFIASLTGIPFFPSVSFSYQNILFIGIATLILSTLITFLVVMKSFKMDIQQSLKYETKFLEKEPLIEKIIKKIRKNIHPFTSYNIRRISGKKIHLLFISLALVISSCFLVFAYSLPDSVNYSLDYKVNQIEKWDGMATTWNYEDTNIINNNFTDLSSIQYHEFGIIDRILFNKYNTSEFNEYLRVIAFENDSILHNFKLERGSSITDEGECYITKDIFKEFSLAIGGTIYVKNQTSLESHKITIKGVVNDFAESTIYFYLESVQKILGESNKVNTVYFTIASNNSEALAQVEDLEYVDNVILKVDVEKMLNESSELFNLFTIAFGIIFTLFGLLISGIIVKNLIEYRIEDYANMKALGLYNSEIKKSILKEILLYFVISIPIGISLGNIISILMLDLMSDVMMGISYYMYPISYIYFGLNIFAIVFIVLILQFRKVKKMNITEITKMKTFG